MVVNEALSALLQAEGLLEVFLALFFTVWELHIGQSHFNFWSLQFFCSARLLRDALNFATCLHDT